MDRNIGMELNLAVGKIKCVSSNFILSTLNALHFNIEVHLSNSTIIMPCPSSYNILRSINSTIVSADLVYEGFVAN